MAFGNDKCHERCLHLNRIITCGFSDNLITKISDFAFDNFISKGVEPSRLCFVFGGRRPSLFLKKELAKRARGPMLSPSFFTMEDFMKEIVSANETLSFVPDIEAAYVIYELCKKSFSGMLGKRESFADFLPWAYEILSFINRADMEEVGQEALLNIEANAGIGYDIPVRINELLRNLNALRESFHSEVAGRKMMTQGLMYLAASKYAKGFDLARFDAVIFGNLFYLHKTEEEVVSAVYGSGKGVMFFQGDSSEWSVLKRHERTFSCEIRSSKENKPDINLYRGYDIHSQASIARHIISGIDSPDNSVLVLPDPSALMPVITSITSVAEDFNVSMGYPVEKSSLFSLVEAVFKAQESKKGKEYYTRDYLGVMLHPLAKNMKLPCDPNVTRTLIHKVEEVLTTDTDSAICGRLFIDPDDVLNEEKIFTLSFEAGVNAGRDELKNVLRQFNNFFFRIWEGAGTFRELDEKIRSFAEGIAEKSFAAYYPLNSKAVESLMEISTELANTSFGSEPIPAPDILKILLMRVKDEFVSFPGTPLKGFQVLGLLESRSLSFENVIVLNANETILPKLKASEPLIPREVMLSLGINRVEKEEEIQRYEFFRLIKGARNVHLVYSDSEKNERSRFIEELLWEKEKQDKTFKLKAASFGFRAEPPRGKRSFEKSSEVSASLREMKYTATNVNTYLECPLRFYFRHVLRVKEKETYTDEPGGSEIGRFIHDLLFKYFTELIGKKPVYDSVFEKHFMEMLDKSFEETFSKRMRAGSFMVKEVVFHRMKLFLEKERERNPKKIVALEKTYSSAFDLGGRSYSFESRIDRIDELEDGSLLILDYKTGGIDGIKSRSSLPDEAAFTRGSIKKYIGSFQLPIYLNLVQKNLNDNNIDASLYDLRSSELSYFFKDGDREERKIRALFCGKALEFIMAEINNPLIPFTPDDSEPGQCGSCPYFYMCR